MLLMNNQGTFIKNARTLPFVVLPIGVIRISIYVLILSICLTLGIFEVGQQMAPETLLFVGSVQLRNVVSVRE